MKRCPTCGSDSVILESRQDANSDTVRRRQCQGCGRRWLTRESVVSDAATCREAVSATPNGLAETLAMIREAGDLLRNPHGCSADVEAMLAEADMRLADIAVEIENAWIGRV